MEALQESEDRLDELDPNYSYGEAVRLVREGGGGCARGQRQATRARRCVHRRTT